MAVAVSQTASPDTRALSRALAQHLTARRVSARDWMVASSTGRGEYRVTVDGAEVRCGCPAGSHGRNCKHSALVKVLDASGAVPIPAPTRPDQETIRRYRDLISNI